jgi:mannose-6-phosphate isomerase-like protein (cupin superfamily)
MPDINPGDGSLPAAELKHVTRVSDVEPIPIGEETRNEHDDGVYWPLIARYVNGSSDFDIGIYRMEANQHHPAHHHPDGAEFYYVLEGSALITVAGEEVEAERGTAFYMPVGTVHSVRTRENESVSILYGFNRGDFRDCGMLWE